MSSYESLRVLMEAPGPLPPPTRGGIPRLRRGEVLLRVRASSVNYHDYAGVSGMLPGLAWPRVPFSDASGEVLALGDGVFGFSVGERVIPNFFPYWRDGRPSAAALASIHGDQADGALQTHMITEAACLARTPSHLNDLEAATLACAGLTAWRALIVEGGLRPGGHVVVQGTGGVSLFALGVAKMAGATVILTSSSDEKLEKGRGLGADHLVNYQAQPDWERKVREITGGRGADIVVDVGGATTLSRSVKAAAIGGYVACIGVLTGNESPAFPLADVMMKNVRVGGLTVGSRRELEEMCRAVEACGYRPVLDKTFALSEAQGAIERLLSQKHFGKITIAIP